MGNVQERLGMLCAKTSNMENIGGGGAGALSPGDIAAALAGTERGPYLFAIAKYAGDESVVTELNELVYKMVIHEAHDRGWKTRTKTALRKMAVLALIESELIPQRCGQCKGRMWVIKQKLKIPCEACNGTGNYTRSARSRARYLEVDWRGYRNTWSLRLDIIKGTLMQWETDIAQKLCSELRREQ